MSPPVFTVNFRREAYRQELARTRRRTVALATWLGYFGAMAVVFGLYALNLASLAQRTRQLENQNATLRATQGPAATWKPGPADLALAERGLASAPRWGARLQRLAALLPPNAMLTTVIVNPDNMADPAEQEKLVITGLLKAAPGQDRMQGIMALVSALHGDPVFSAQYRVIRLAESRIIGGPETPAEFKIEFR